MAQGSFRNLNFELANVPDTIPGQYGDLQPTVSALPGWLVTVEGYPQPVSFTYHNTLNYGGVGTMLHGPGWASVDILEGRYSLRLIRATAPVFGLAPSISQTGEVPIEAQSLRFWTPPFRVLDVRLGGESLALIQLEQGASYNVWGADISRFAGMTAELRFTGGALIDNIFFSPLVIPEPSTISFALAGFGFLGWRALRRWNES